MATPNGTTENNQTPTQTADLSVEELNAQLAKAREDLERANKRVKDTQVSYTKGQQELARLRAEKEARDSLPKPSTEEQERLEQLKYDDPDAWFLERKKLEEANKKYVTEVADAKLAELTTQQVLAERESILHSFNSTAPIPITDEVIEYDIPRRIKAKLEKGEVSFEDFLIEASTYLSKGKTVEGKHPTMEQPSLGKTTGGTTPVVTDANYVRAYENTIF